MSKHQQPPSVVRTKNGDMYRLVILKIVSKDEWGRPWECEVLYDEQAAEIVGGEEFMTAYVPEIMIKPKPRK